jgi:hypothetical protein
MKLTFSLLVAFLAAAPPSPAQSLLLVVRDTRNGSPLSAPSASREGLAAALFDGGLMVFDLPGGAPAAADELLKTAVGAEADYVLEMIVDVSSIGSTAPRVAGHAAFTLRKTPGGELVLRDTVDRTNKDRETSVNGQGLAREIGGLVAKEILGRLMPPSP